VFDELNKRLPKIHRKFIVRLMLLVVVVGATYAWRSLPNPRRWDRGYSQISEGDQERKVIEVLGKPTEVKDCHASTFSGDQQLREKCVKEYWYIAFLQEWVYVIDKDDRVIAKWHSVSP
jgi:hypothetical protein